MGRRQGGLAAVLSPQRGKWAEGADVDPAEGGRVRGQLAGCADRQVPCVLRERALAEL